MSYGPGLHLGLNLLLACEQDQHDWLKPLLLGGSVVPLAKDKGEKGKAAENIWSICRYLPAGKEEGGNTVG